METKQWILTLFTKGGEEIDSTTITATDRVGALAITKRFLMFQGLSNVKRTLTLKK
jgi:hypothetical protein